MEKELLVRLVTSAQQGDSTAMDTLFSSFYNDVYYFALKTVKDSDIACDITQEAFLEIINTIGNLNEPAAFVTWMKQITYHQCTRYFKKKKEVLVEEDEDGNTIFDTLADESEGSIPSEVYEQEEFRNTILDIINELTEEQRSAVMMYYFDEMTVGQIAQIQGVSEGTVKSRLNYARKALKKSVESYEKKHNIRLHSIAFLPLFMLFFSKEVMPAAKAAQIQAAVSEAAAAAGTGAAVTASAAGAAATASVGTAAAAAGAGFSAKVAAIPLVAKIIAGVVAVSIAVGGTVAATAGRHQCQDADLDCLCDTCGKAFHHDDPALSHNAFCILCGEAYGIRDKNRDNICDECGEYPCGPIHREDHAFADGLCTCCGAEENPHLDTDSDGYCDHCGNGMCVLDLGEHRIPDGSCLCEICGNGSHTEGEFHPFCGICRERLPLDDQDGDGACDVCGEYSCGGSYHGINAHTDDNQDNRCDICQKYMCELIWDVEHYVNYDDGIYDGKCDNCGSSVLGAKGGEDDRPHADANSDNLCDCCGNHVCRIPSMPSYGGVDANGDNKCDICQFFMCDGHDGVVYHYDFDHDGKCDRCEHYICAHGYLPHTDENGDGICELCYGYV